VSPPASIASYHHPRRSGRKTLDLKKTNFIPIDFPDPFPNRAAVSFHVESTVTDNTPKKNSPPSANPLNVLDVGAIARK